MRKLSLFLLLIAIVAFAAQPAAAQDTKHKVYVGIAQIMPMSSETIDGAEFEAQSALGFGLGYEYRLNELIGLDFDFMLANLDMEVEGEKFGKLDFMPLSAGANFHFFSKDKIDLYAGPTLSYVTWGDLEIDSAWQSFAGTDKVSVDSAFAFGATIGIDVGNKKYAFTGGLRYLMVDASPEDAPLDIGVDPLMIRLGFAYKF